MFRFLLPWLAAALAASAAAPARVPLREFFDNPQYASAEISPDGKRLAFLAPSDHRLNIWVCDAGASLDSARQITHEKERGIYSFSWSRDGRWILYSHDANGDENFHVFRADPAQPDARALDLTPQAKSRGDVLDLPAGTPGEADVAWNKRDPHYFDAYRIDLATGAATLIAQNPGDVEAWCPDTHGKILGAVAALKNTDTEIRARADEASPFKVVTTYHDDDEAAIYDFSPDGTFLYATSARGANLTRLVKLDIATGKETVIDSDPEYDCAGPVITAWSHTLLGAQYDRERFSYKAFDPAFQKDLDTLAKVHDGDIAFGDMTADERKWIVSFNSPTDPGATYLYDRDSGKAQFIFRPRPWLKPEMLAEMKPVTLKSRDGLTLHGYLSLPRGMVPHYLPAVLVVHGGPWTRNNWGYDPESAFLANRGYAVLHINYRGSTGFGKKFEDAGNKEWGGKMTDDMVDAAHWLIAQGIADPKRFAIYGGSYGGYATLAAMAFRPGVFACGIDYVGVANLLTFMNTIPPYWEASRQVLYKRVGNPVTERAMLRSHSPVFFADQIEGPLFIAQGYNDPRVNHNESEQIVNALRKAGKPVEYLLKMDEGHGFRNPENRLDFYAKMEAFLDRYIGKAN
ncbi:MAG TPA: S9 family peptidase [Chthoniobacteraceae bacterium]|jgi:dipeptidyl aminopeptidase/acylaminoacyl peptidase|nr:S9 family peptidase [Chthoniobacteraceae bacterium]